MLEENRAVFQAAGQRDATAAVKAVLEMAERGRRHIGDVVHGITSGMFLEPVVLPRLAFPVGVVLVDAP